MSVDLNGIVTWLKGWFYDKDDITSKEQALQAQINNKASQSDLNTTNSTLSALSDTVDGKLNSSDYVVDTTLSDSSTNPLQNKAINTALGDKAPKSHASTATTYGVGSANNYGHVKVDSSLNSSSTNTVQNKVINSALNNKASSTHTHGNLTNDGKMDTASAIVMTDSNRNIVTSTGITTAYVVDSQSHSNIGSVAGDSLFEILDDINTALGNKANSSTVSNKADKTGGVSQITDSNAHSNIGTSANATQATINTAIDAAIGNLTSVELVEIVSTLPTASASTMNKLYLKTKTGGTGQDTYDIYITVKNGTTYSWEKIDDFDLQDLGLDDYYTKTETNNLLDAKAPKSHASTATTYGVGSANNYGHVKVDTSLSSTSTNPIQNKAVNTALSGKASSTHTHGNLTNDGKLDTASAIVITDSNKKITTTSVISGAYVVEAQAYSNIGSSVGDDLTTILSDINTALGNKANSSHTHSNYMTTGSGVTSIALVPKSTDNTGAIRLYYGDEP